MKWVGRLMASAAAVLLTTGSGSASVGGLTPSAETAWAEVVKADTLEAYAEFAMAYPDSEHALLAYSKLFGAKAISDGTKPESMTILDEDEGSTPGLLPGVLRII